MKRRKEVWKAVRKLVLYVTILSLLMGDVTMFPTKIFAEETVQTMKLQECTVEKTENSNGSYIDVLGKNGETNVDLKGQPYGEIIEGRLVRNGTEKAWAWREYNIQGYAKFTAYTVVFRESENVDDYDVSLTFFGDGNKLKSYRLTPSVANFDINIDVTGISVLRVCFEDNKAVTGMTSYGLADAILHPAQDVNKLQKEADEGWLEAQPIIGEGRYTGNVGDSFIDTISGQRRIERTVGKGNGNIDINGNKYEHGVEAWIARWNFTAEKSWAWISYDIDKKYSYLQGQIVQIKSYNTGNFDATLFFYGDDNLLASYALKPGQVNQEFEVDVTGVKELKVSVADNTAVKGGTSFGIVNAQFASKTTLSYSPVVNHYYAHETKKLTPQGKVNRDAIAFQDAINTYLEVLKANTEKEQKKDVSDYDVLGAKLQAEDQALGANRHLNFVGFNTAQEKAIYQAYAKFLTEYYREGVEMGKIDIDEPEMMITTRILNDIMNLTDGVEFSEKFNGVKVHFSVTCEAGAFSGSMFVDGKPIIVNSNADEVASVMTQYVNELSDITKDVVKQGLWSLVDFLEKESMIQDIVEKDIQDVLKDKITGIQSRGLGNVLKYILKYKKGYEVTSAFINADNSKAFAKALRNADIYVEELDKLEFETDEVIANKAVTSAMDTVNKAKKQFRNTLYSYVYESGKFEGPTKWESFLRFFGIHCPVDFTLYDDNNNVIGYVSEGEVYYDENVAYIVVNGDAKSIYVSENMNVRLEMQATDNGTMDYFVEDLTENGLYGRMNFYNVPLTEGQKFTQVISEGTLTRKIEDIPLMSDGENMLADEYIPATGDKDALVTISVSTEGNGYVIGDGEYVKGDLVKLTANPEEGYRFVGWYDGEKKVYDKASYYFTAVSDLTLRAVFELANENAEEREEEDYTIKVNNIELDKTQIEIEEGEEISLEAMINPSNADEKRIGWISDNTSVAVVRGGVVKTLNAGTTKIIAYAMDGSGVRAECVVQVKKKQIIDNSGNETENGSNSNTENGTDGTNNNTNVKRDDIVENNTESENDDGKLKKGERDATGQYVAISQTEAAYKPKKKVHQKKVVIADTVVIAGVELKVTKIDNSALKNNKYIENVIVGKNIKVIGKNAFSGTKKLKKISFKGKSIEKIDNRAFKNAVKLKTVDLSNQSKLNAIGSEAFRGSKALKTIKVRASKLNSIGKNATKGINSKVTITIVAKNAKEYKAAMKKLKNAGAKKATYRYKSVKK